jgi:sorbitol-specific phosphotransferase system component IIA
VSVVELGLKINPTDYGVKNVGKKFWKNLEERLIAQFNTTLNIT